jgi:hypothetical protein
LLGAHLFDPVSPVLAKKVKPQAVFFGIDFVNQTLPELRPLGRIYQAFEDGLLHALAEVAAFLGNMAKPFPALGSFRIHVVGHDHKHSGLISRTLSGSFGARPLSPERDSSLRSD